MKLRELRSILNTLAPEETQCDWDNSGLLVGDPDQEIRTVYLAVDALSGTIRRAEEAGADLILTHHPLIFRGLKRVSSEDFVGRRVMELVKAGISLYAMHTDFDQTGMREAIDRRLGLMHSEVLDPEEGMGSIGDLSGEASLDELAGRVRDAFGLSAVKVFGDGKTRVRRAAVCGGSGRSMIGAALSGGAQVYVTGDIDHHSGIDAVEEGLSIIDAGHWGLEHVFQDYMEDYLTRKAPELKLVKEPLTEPFHYV